ncbi:3-dehydroquinate dehydratase, type II [Atractiella rhizophila]|nr:3-dehydroquinate dehydratase, type II [Atractiella rhizophila]
MSDSKVQVIRLPARFPETPTATTAPVERDHKTILLLHGPSHNLFGTRKPEVYGTTTLEQIEERATRLASELGYKLVVTQCNNDGDAIDHVHNARKFGALIMNPGAWCHYNYALRDAIESVPQVPYIEIHISNLYAREEFRKTSVLAPLAKGLISGAGIFGYDLALRCAIQRIEEGLAAENK